jgi:ABC-type multidrug transport system ATPase subunit
MKLDRRLTKWERQRRIEELLENLSLRKCQHTRIEKLSGGEKKRLSFASEIISEKYLVFADESTTGLDSFSAQRIVGVMKSLAAKGKTVLCTIHQPSSQVFAMFDQVCLLAEGRTAYLGSTAGAKQFLTNLGHICPQQFNPADFYIRTLAVFPGKEEESKRNIKDICDSFANSKHYAEMETDIFEEISRYDFFHGSKSSDSVLRIISVIIPKHIFN